MKVPVTILGEKKAAGDIDLGWLAKAQASPLLMAQVIHTDQQRRRIRRAHTKDRAEVRGGGKKPWKQKGTGRARHASIRSPLWVGGGTTFGPRSRHEYKNRLPLAMRRRALNGMLGEALRTERLQIVRLPETIPTKTREFARLVPTELRSLLLIVAAEHSVALQRIGRNVPAVTVKDVAQVTVADLVGAQQIWFDEAALSSWKK